MVSIDQIANGVLVYIRDYLIGQIPKDNYKYVTGNVALEILGMSLMKNKQVFVDRLIQEVRNSPFASFLDVVSPEGMVDIETIRAVMPKYIQPEGFKVRIPMIGTFSILPNDVDVIYNCIVNTPTAQRTITGGASQ